MNFTNLCGTWINQFGSLMTISYCNPYTGVLSGTYASSTGATGVYRLIGITDKSPDPNVNSQTISFSVSWRSISGPNDDTQYWVSAFAGQYQIINNVPTITTSYLLQHNTNPADNWGSTIIDKSTFVPHNAI